MTPQTNNSESRMVEFIQYATILRREKYCLTPRSHEHLRMVTRNEEIILSPYNEVTAKYLKNLAKDATEYGYTCRLTQTLQADKVIISAVFSPRKTDKAASPMGIIRRDYYNIVTRIY